LILSQDSGVRGHAAYALARLKVTKAVEYIAPLLYDESSFTRKQAAIALKLLAWEPSNNNKKIDYLVVSNNWDALIKIGTPAVDPLIAKLNDNNPDIL